MEPVTENVEQLPELVPQNIIRVETALSRFPTHRLSKKGDVDINIVEAARDGEVRVRWAVSHSSRHGQPGPLAYKIDTLIVYRRIEELKRPVPRLIRLGSLSNICEQLGLTDSGKNRNNVKHALRQNAFAGVSAKIRYRQNDGRERTLEADFTRYSVVFTGETFPDDEKRKADAVYIILNDIFMQVINGAMTRPLDYEYLKVLPAGSQRFYELLSYQMFAALKYGRPQARLVYSEFCSYAPQTRYFDSNRVHKQMAKVHAPHKKSGYIRDIEFEHTTDPTQQPDWILHYTPGPRARAEYRAFAKRGGPTILEMDLQSPPALPAETKQLSDLERELTARGVTEAIARELCAQYPEERIRRQIEFADYEKKHGRKKITGLGGYLTKAIRTDFAEPAGYAEARQRKAREDAEREKSKAEAELKRKQHEEQRRERLVQRKVTDYWLSLSTDEQKELDRQALEVAEPAVAETYREFLSKNSRFADTLFKTSIRHPYIKRRLRLSGN